MFLIMNSTLHYFFWSPCTHNIELNPRQSPQIGGHLISIWHSKVSTKSYWSTFHLVKCFNAYCSLCFVWTLKMFLKSRTTRICTKEQRGQEVEKLFLRRNNEKQTFSNTEVNKKPCQTCRSIGAFKCGPEFLSSVSASLAIWWKHSLKCKTLFPVAFYS